MSRLYGFVNTDLEDARGIVEAVTGRRLAPHESFYHGGDYYRLREGDAELILQRNYDCLDDDLAESEFPDADVLIYLAGGELAEEIAEKLRSAAPRAKLLRHLNYSSQGG